MDIPIEKILERLDLLECQVAQHTRENSQKGSKNFPEFLTMDGLVEYLFYKTGRKFAKPTIYGWINKKSVPYIKRDHLVLFERIRIDGWLVSGREPTYKELITQADVRMVAANRKRRTSIAR